MDWEALKNEYATTGISLRELSKKYDLKENTVFKQSRNHGWTDARKQAASKMAAETIKRISGDRAKRIERMMAVSDKILEAIENITQKDLDAQSVKQITGALKDLRDIQGLHRTELDIKEQEARIRSLEERTKDSDQDERERGVIVLPEIIQKGEPPDE